MVSSCQCPGVIDKVCSHFLPAKNSDAYAVEELQKSSSVDDCCGNCYYWTVELWEMLGHIVRN